MNNKKNCKKNISKIMAIMCLIMSISSFSFTSFGGTISFNDVKSNAWYYSSLEYCVDNGYINGMTATTFEPDGLLTRAQFVKILGCMANAKPESKVSRLSDVSKTHWAYNYIQWALNQGITTGTAVKNGVITFSPDDKITREQLAVFTARYMRAKNYDLNVSKTAKKVSDMTKVSSWAKDDIQLFADNSLLFGTDGKMTSKSTVTCKPKEYVKRAEVSATLARVDKLVKGIDTRDNDTELTNPTVEKSYAQKVYDGLDSKVFSIVERKPALNKQLSKAADLIAKGKFSSFKSAIIAGGFTNPNWEAATFGSYEFENSQTAESAVVNIINGKTAVTVPVSPDGEVEGFPLHYTDIGIGADSNSGKCVVIIYLDENVIPEDYFTQFAADIDSDYKEPEYEETNYDGANLDIVKINVIGVTDENNRRYNWTYGTPYYIEKYIPLNVINRFNSERWAVDVLNTKSYAIKWGISNGGMTFIGDKCIYLNALSDHAPSGTICHEFGHFVQHYSYGYNSSNVNHMYSYADAIVKIQQNAHKKISTPSDYAKTDSHECFAEAFMLYCIAPEELKAECPEYYEFVDKAVKML